MNLYDGARRKTMRELVREGAQTGTFSYSERHVIHAYVELPSRSGSLPYIACGLHGLVLWREHHPETMDWHEGRVTCGRCRRILGAA